MKFVVLLLFSPLVASSFTSLCPQQPNNVVVNCNNQNPFPFQTIPGTTIPVRGRVLDVAYDTQSRGSKLEFQRRKSDSSEESNSESDESSEEIVDLQIPYYPTHTVNRPQVPSIHSTTTVDSKLDFLRHGTGGKFRNNMRTFPTRNDIRGYIQLTRDDINSGMPFVDETHGHGHSGQYNHDVHNYEHNHHHGHNHHHHGHGNQHGHGHHSHGHHVNVPTHITHPINNPVVGTHVIPEHALPIGSILSGATTDIFVNNEGNINMDRGDPRIDSPIVQLSAVHPNLRPNTLQDTQDRLVLTQRGYRALGDPSVSKTTYELESLLSSIVPIISVPTVHQDGLNTEINCDPIPIDSSFTQTTGMQGTVGQTPLIGDQQISPTFTITGNAQDFPETSHIESTVTKVEERPVMTTGIRNPMEESLGSTVTKVTTTKVDKRPTVENTGSTVTKVTTTKTEERPMSTHEQHMGSTVTKVTTTTSEKLPVEGAAQSSSSGSTITTVTTTKTEERPINIGMTIPETIINEMPVQTSSSSGSTVTKVTTTKTEGRPIITEMTIPETIINETPVQTSSSSGSTVTKVTTTKTEGRPIITEMTIPETIINETPVQTSSSSGSTITTVTTTKTEGSPVITDITLPETIVPVENGQSSSQVTTTTITEDRPITTLTEIIGGGEADTLVPISEVGDVVSDGVADVSGFAKLVRPTRDGTYRYDRYRQRMSPFVYGV